MLTGLNENFNNYLKKLYFQNFIHGRYRSFLQFIKLEVICYAKSKLLTAFLNPNKFLYLGLSRSTFERLLRKAKGHKVYIFNTIDVWKKRKLRYCEICENPCSNRDCLGASSFSSFFSSLGSAVVSLVFSSLATSSLSQPFAILAMTIIARTHTHHFFGFFRLIFFSLLILDSSPLPYNFSIYDYVTIASSLY